jgi:hypothetical protein
MKKLIVMALVISMPLGMASAAGLKNKPPQGISLGGTEWLLDPYRSDDPIAAIEKAHQEQQEQAEQKAKRDRDRTERGGVFGGDDPWDNRNSGGGTWGGGTPGGGGWGQGGDRGSTTIDPTGETQSATVRWGSSSGLRNAFLTQLDKNPERISFRHTNERVTVTEDTIDTDCSPGEKETVADSFGDGERHCGWEGRAWVVETARGKDFRRTDRYELSKDGKTLNYVTTATGRDMPKVRISRTYSVAPSPR